MESRARDQRSHRDKIGRVQVGLFGFRPGEFKAAFAGQKHAKQANPGARGSGMSGLSGAAAKCLGQVVRRAQGFILPLRPYRIRALLTCDAELQ
jgi:hypothetical protein